VELGRSRDSQLLDDEDKYSLCYMRGPAGIIVALVCATTTNALIQDNGLTPRLRTERIVHARSTP